MTTMSLLEEFWPAAVLATVGLELDDYVPIPPESPPRESFSLSAFFCTPFTAPFLTMALKLFLGSRFLAGVSTSADGREAGTDEELTFLVVV